MKSTKGLIATLALFAAATAGAGGVAVTNGKKLYSLDGFTVQYAPELTLHVASKTMFDISNPGLVQASEQVSKVSFTVAHEPGKKLADVLSDLKSKFPGENIQAIQQPGASGYFWENNAPSSLKGHYDLLTSNGDLVDIELQAFAAGDGIQWVAPIVHSLVYDSTAPVLLGFRFENQVWEAGSVQILHLHLTDDYSGVKPEFSFSIEAPNRHATSASSKAYYYVTDTKLVPEGNDWYKATIPVSQYMPNQKFRFSSLTFTDLAGNSRRYEAELNDATYTASPAAHAMKVSTLRVQVVNHGTEDFTAPQIMGFRPDASVWEVGSTHRVYFKITDDVSGVDLSNQEVGISQPCSLFKVNEGQSTGGRACNGASPGEFIHYRAEGNDWYSAEYTVRDYMPSGKYRIGALVVNDKAGNLLMYSFNSPQPGRVTSPGLLPTFEFTLHNGGQEDITPPEFLDWKIDTATWKVGGEGKIYLRARDNASGVSLQEFGVIFSRVDGAKTASVESDSRSVVAEGGDWYSMTVPVDQFLEAGTYYPSFVMMNDKAANETLVDCKPDGTCQVRSGQAMQLQSLRIEIVR